MEEDIDGNLSVVPNDGNVKLRVKLKGGVFLTSVAGTSMLFGFVLTIAAAKKRYSNMFSKSINGIGSQDLEKAGTDLGFRALGWGTLYSVTGVSAFTFLLWRLTGCTNMKDLRDKVQGIAPQVRSKPHPGRSVFDSVRDLVQYLMNEEKHNSISDTVQKRDT